MIKKIVFSLSIPLFLFGCSVTTTPSGKQVKMLPLVADKSRYLEADDKTLTKAEKLEIYSNQLSKFYGDENKAYIRVLPRPSYQTNDQFTPIPFMVYEIDTNPVRIFENKIFNLNNVRTTEYAQYDLRIPIGTHDLIIVNGLGKSRWFTKIDQVNFEKDKKYVIGADIKTGQNAQIFIAEYEVDPRFKSVDEEYFIIKKRLVENIEIGNLKNVKIF